LEIKNDKNTTFFNFSLDNTGFNAYINSIEIEEWKTSNTMWGELRMF